MKNLISTLTILISCILVSCSSSKTSNGQADGDTVAFKYARHLTIVKMDGYTKVDLVDPWKEGKILHTYYLVPKGSEGDELSAELKSKGKTQVVEASSVVRTPVDRSIVFTTVHSALLMELGAKEKISGVCDSKYIHIPWIQQQLKVGKIADCGNGMNADVEKIIDSKPGIILVSPFENSGGYGKLEEIDIPIIEAADYMETSALGRAEWMKFYGMLYGKETEANRLFEQVDSTYQALKQEATKSKIQRSLITEMKMGGVWYVPGGQSVAGTLFKDAGGKYVFGANKDQGSLNYPFEKVLDEAGNADVWTYKYDSHPATLQEIYSDYQGYGEMKAWKTGEVYGCNTSTSTYYEEASFHPERVLRDYIIILHPDLKLGALRYYQRIPH